MIKSFIALDLETTGLSAKEEKIIESKCESASVREYF